MTAARIVTLTTDFGHQDAYVAVMKGVILSRAPAVVLVDVTHEVPPQNVSVGSFLLESVWPYYPQDAVHLGVVDPGVGTSRRPIAVRSPHGIFVGPDNGLSAGALIAQEVLDPASGTLTGAEAVTLENSEYHLSNVSTTFHGRDIFAPAAAHLASDGRLGELGPSITVLDRGVVAVSSLRSGILTGMIRHVDRFGNLITNLPAARLPRNPEVQVGELVIAGLSRTYQEREIMTLIGSSGYLEIAVRNGSAADQLGLTRGAVVKVRAVD